MFKDKETLSDTIEKIKHTLPLDFDYIKYLEYNSDLPANGINTEELADIIICFLVLTNKECISKCL